MAKKKAAVYDRWLHTLGGGEQVAFAYAETLAELGYETTLLTHKEVDIEKAKRKMNVSLEGVAIRYIPNLPDFELSQFTEHYDVFVCNSFLDYVPNRAKFGILSLFFPSKINVSFYEYLKRAHIVPSLRKFFVYPSQFSGFAYDQFDKGKLHKWLGNTSTIEFSQNINKLEITLYFDYLTVSHLDSLVFKVGDEAVDPKNRTVNRHTNMVDYEFQLLSSSKQTVFSIHQPNNSENLTKVSLVTLSIPNLRYLFYNFFKYFFPKWEMRLHGGPSVTRYSDIESYDKILSISEFCRGWVKKYWGLQSELLYPPVAVEDFYASPQKKNMIAHVGRFFVGGNSKKQLDLVRVFKKLLATGAQGWELHLVGSVAAGRAHQLYFDQVVEESRGYPIFIHTDVPFTKLKQILSLSKIYWHATGLDEPVEKKPVSLEHFGITTVEAMASGCVPVVIDKGGQPEVVTSESGYTWNTRAELLSITKTLISKPKEIKLKREAALKRSKLFSRSRFKKQLTEHLELQV